MQGIVTLFHPFVEGAIHDLESGEIVALYNNFSKRSVGDKSPLHELKVNTDQFPDVFEPYIKINWDGKKLKCISVTVRDGDGKPAGLICLNFDISMFGDFSRQLLEFLSVRTGAENPVDLFGDAWEDKLQAFIRDFLTENNLSESRMTSQDKQQLVRALYESGYFNYKYAVQVIARQLRISRATVYNYLK
ncbi:helix-turn-helix domain-containing protein [bacterium]|nr:helix-turn-helix domain-containing protein [bacterium]